jgi:hypothetical protein
MADVQALNMNDRMINSPVRSEAPPPKWRDTAAEAVKWTGGGTKPASVAGDDSDAVDIRYSNENKDAAK